jgi:hypothetical protein
MLREEILLMPGDWKLGDHVKITRGNEVVVSAPSGKSLRRASTRSTSTNAESALVTQRRTRHRLSSASCRP